jgi:hypothetical protein
VGVSSIVFVYAPAVLFWLSLAFVVFAHFWIKYRDGVRRRARERETLERMKPRPRSTRRDTEERIQGY